jgi:hypothetical protein
MGNAGVDGIFLAERRTNFEAVLNTVMTFGIR